MSSWLEVRLLGANTVWSAPNDACAAGGLTQVPTTRTVPSSLPITAYYNDSKVGSSSPKSKWAKNLLFSCCLQWMGPCSQSLSETHSGRGAKQELQHRKLQLHTRNKVFIVWVKSDTEAGWPKQVSPSLEIFRAQVNTVLSDLMHPSLQGLGWMTSRASTTRPLFHNDSFRRRTYTAPGITSPLQLFSPGIPQSKRTLEGKNGERDTLIIDIQLINSVVSPAGTRVSFFLYYLCCPDVNTFSCYSGSWYAAWAYKHFYNKHELEEF